MSQFCKPARSLVDDRLYGRGSRSELIHENVTAGGDIWDAPEASTEGPVTVGPNRTIGQVPGRNRSDDSQPEYYTHQMTAQ